MGRCDQARHSMKNVRCVTAWCCNLLLRDQGHLAKRHHHMTSFECDDGDTHLAWERVEDDFCDCIDGTADEVTTTRVHQLPFAQGGSFSAPMWVVCFQKHLNGAAIHPCRRWPLRLL